MTATLPKTRYIHVTETGEEESYLSELVGYPVIRVQIIAATSTYIDEVTTTYDRDGEPRVPPGRGWIRCQSHNGSTTWQRRRSLP